VWARRRLGSESVVLCVVFLFLPAKRGGWLFEEQGAVERLAPVLELVEVVPVVLSVSQRIPVNRIDAIDSGANRARLGRGRGGAHLRARLRRGPLGRAHRGDLELRIGGFGDRL